MYNFCAFKKKIFFVQKIALLIFSLFLSAYYNYNFILITALYQCTLNKNRKFPNLIIYAQALSKEKLYFFQLPKSIYLIIFFDGEGEQGIFFLLFVYGASIPSFNKNQS